MTATTLGELRVPRTEQLRYCTVDKEQKVKLQLVEKGGNLGPHFVVYLDKLSPQELASRSIKIDSTRVLSFAKEFNEYLAAESAKLKTSLGDRQVYQDFSTSLAKRYETIYQEYVRAYTLALHEIAAAEARPVPLPPKPDLGEFYQTRKQEYPRIEIEYLPGSAEAPAQKPENDSVNFIFFASHSPVIRKKMESSEPIKITTQVPATTIQKIIKFMYDHKPFEVESDQEAAQMHQFAQEYEIQYVQDLCAPRAWKSKISAFDPQHLSSLETVREELQKANPKDYMEIYERAVGKVNEFFKGALGEFVVEDAAPVVDALEAERKG